MASNCVSTSSSRDSPDNIMSDKEIQNCAAKTQSDHRGSETFEQIMPGAQFAEKHTFRNKKGDEISCTPLIVDFKRLLKTGGTASIIPGVPNQDLLHAVVGLYDVSLSDMETEVIYDSVCDDWARTILLIRDIKDTISSLQSRHDKDREKASQITDDSSSVDQSLADSSATEDGKESPDKEGEDKLEPEEGVDSKFADVYSDTEEEEEEDSDEEEEEDFSKGINAYIKSAKERRKTRIEHDGPVQAEHVGIENRLIACATFKKSYCKSGEKIHHLTLIAVRKRLRKWGIGRYLLMQVKDPHVVGTHDAVVVHADNSAVNFFSRYGFSDDPVLNTRWSEIAEQFTNCTLMSYLPPFTGQNFLGKDTPEIDLIEMEKEIKKWKDRSLEAYQSQMSCLYRVRHEIIHLRALVSSQQELISALATENKNLTEEKFQIEKEYLKFRLSLTQDMMDSTEKELSADMIDDDDDDENVYSSDDIIKELESQMATIKLARDETAKRMLHAMSEERNFATSNQNSDEPYDHGKDMEEFFNVTCDFKESMKRDKANFGSYEVSMINKAHLSSTAQEAYKNCIKQLQDPSILTRLYYCGGLEKPERINDILKNGFSEEDFNHGEYGRGLYFSKFPSRAAQFSMFGRLILCEVGIGKTETITKKDVTRNCASDGHDSIITPGRMVNITLEGDSTYTREYVIFTPHQASPVYIVDYTSV